MPWFHPILVVIERLPFRVAKTMPHIPHSYTVRGQGGGDEKDYIALFHTIWADGTRERYNKSYNNYLYPGDDHKYWAMTNKLDIGDPPRVFSRIINRMQLAADLPRMLETGQAMYRLRFIGTGDTERSVPFKTAEKALAYAEHVRIDSYTIEEREPAAVPEQPTLPEIGWPPIGPR